MGERRVDVIEIGGLADGRDPDRQLHPRSDVVREQELGIDPRQRCGGPGHLLAERQQLGHRGVAGRAEHVHRAAQRRVDRERGKVTRIDVLQRVVGRAGCEHGATGRDAAEPPGQPADVLARADDQPRPREERTVRTEDALDGKLGAALVRRVVGAV